MRSSKPEPLQTGQSRGPVIGLSAPVAIRAAGKLAVTERDTTTSRRRWQNGQTSGFSSCTDIHLYFGPIPANRRERSEAAVGFGRRTVTGPREAWVATDPFNGPQHTCVSARVGQLVTIAGGGTTPGSCSPHRVSVTFHSRSVGHRREEIDRRTFPPQLEISLIGKDAWLPPPRNDAKNCIGLTEMRWFDNFLAAKQENE